MKEGLPRLETCVITYQVKCNYCGIIADGIQSNEAQSIRDVHRKMCPAPYCSTVSVIKVIKHSHIGSN